MDAVIHRVLRKEGREMAHTGGKGASINLSKSIKRKACLVVKTLSTASGANAIGGRPPSTPSAHRGSSQWGFSECALIGAQKREAKLLLVQLLLLLCKGVCTPIAAGVANCGDGLESFGVLRKDGVER